MLPKHPRTYTALLAVLLIVLILCSCSSKQDTETTTDNQSRTLSIEATTVTKTEAFTETETALTEASPEKIEYPFKSGCFYCVETDELLFEHNINKRIAPASLAKILTALVAYHFAGPEAHLTVGTELSLLKPHSSLSLISKGQTLTLQDLTYGLLLASGNDAAYTIAAGVARSLNARKSLSDSEAVAFFVKQMNSFSELIGMKNSHFTSPDGWDDEKQYTTVSDLLTLTKCVVYSEALREIVSAKEKYTVFVTGENITWKNSNQLLNPDSKHYNPYAVGMKTGTTKKAGNCLIALFEKDSKTYICIVTGCKTNDSRYEAANKLFSSYVK